MSPKQLLDGGKFKVIFPILSISWHGGTRVLIQVANHLAALGYPVVLLVARNRCKTPFRFANGVTVKQVGIHTGLKAVDYLVFLCSVPFQVRGKAVLIANFFVTYYPIRLLAIIKRLPYLYFVQDIESKYQFPRGAILNALCNLTYRDKRIVAANAFLRDRLMNEFGTSSKNIAVGPADIFFTLPPQLHKQYDVIHFLRREPWKGLDRFQRFLQLSKGRLSCVCVSQDTGLGQLIADSGAAFVCPADDAELIRCIDSARVLFFTSYQEGFALPPLEGMARGLPAVLYRCGGPEQYAVEGRNSAYVADEEQALAVIAALVNDPAAYARMSQEARATAKHYRMETSLQSMAEFVEDCVQW